MKAIYNYKDYYKKIAMEKLTGRNFDFQSGEVLNVYKPRGLTSFQVVWHIRKWTGCKKVGHAGTLDPLATGVLLVCTGKATKRSSELMALEKMYKGVIELGKQTKTDDGEGDIIRIKKVPKLSDKEINQVCQRFCGEIEQIPPLYSAIKKNGKPMYRLARQGVELVGEARKINIYDIQIIRWENPEIELLIRCSKGTYIRALARDIGLELSTGGYLKSLCRLKIGPYRVEDSYSMASLKKLLDRHADCS